MQLFGHKNAEIAKRIDIAATAIYHGMTVDAVSDLDLSYTPPLGSPWDAVQMAAQAWVRADPATLNRSRPQRRGAPHVRAHRKTRPSAPPHHPPRHLVRRRDHPAYPGRLHQHQHDSTGTPASAVVAANAGPPGHRPTITGAGSTFDAPFFAVAFARYQQQHPGVTIGYSAVGSSAGIAAISARQVDFGASDVPMTASEQAAAKGGPITQVPVALGGEGVAYNLSLPAGARLHLTGPVLAEIFLGQITRWNDPALTALNPGVTLPPAAITVVHRSDGSGTTYIFSNYLSSVDPAWASKVGTGKTLELAGRGGRRRQRRGGHRRCSAPRSPSATSSRPTPRAWSCRSPPSATRPGTTSSHPAQTVAADAAQKPGITPDRLLHRQPARRQQLPDQRLQLGAGLHPPVRPGQRPGAGYHAGLAHP